jgi:feruloyl esterase
MSRPFGFTAFAFLASALAAAPADAAKPCRELAALWLPHATISSAQSLPAGTFTPPGSTPLTGLPAFCRVEGVSSPTRDSAISFEVWIPVKQDWNSKYLQLGTIGYAGSFQYGAMAAGLRRGYAVASTDTGHRAPVGIDASWALLHPEKIIDWGYRAQKETTDKAKALIRAHTGRAPRLSYFVGGSNGGREALMTAQRYPDDFDGILADGPAILWSRLSATWVWTEQALKSDPASFIAANKLPAIQAAVVTACDMVGDGIADGIVADPRRCHFDPKVLQCAGAESDGCLTAPQVDALKKIISGPRNPRTGQRIFPGFEVGAVAFPEWTVYITGPAFLPFFPLSGDAYFGNGFFANMVFDVGDAAFDFRSVNFDSHIALAESKLVNDEPLSVVIDAADPNLRRFQERGGKIIMHTGWEDPVVPARGVIGYYESVIADQASGGGKHHGARKDEHKAGHDEGLRRTQEFFRFFVAPGAMHFSGTGSPGPDAVGSFWGLPGLRADRRHDVLTALEAWVEQGIAPRKLVATKYVNDDPSRGAARTRPVCPYPQVARWTGQGSTDEAGNFECVEGRRGAYLDAVVMRPSPAK